MIQLNSTTFRAEGLGDRVAPPVIELGGKDASKIAPNLNIGYDFGGGEEAFENTNRTDKIISAKSEVKFDGDKVRLIEGSDIDEIYVDKLGRVKWDVVFEKKPEIMILEWKRTASKRLTAYYQDALTEEEIRDGSVRPDDVVGSYAIYFDRANNYIRPLNKKREIPKDWRSQRAAGAELGDLNIHSYREYKTGKVGHRYRPFVVDSSGRTAWCTLLIVGDIERVTLPKEFMENAKYPVRLDPTFGYTTAGGSSNGFYDVYAPRGSIYGTHEAASGDVITQFSVYAQITSGGTTVDMAAYTVVSSDLSSRLAAGVTLSFNSEMGLGWKNSAEVSQSLSSGSVYGVAFGNFGANTDYIYYDSGTGYTKRHSTVGALPATWSTNATQNYIFSIYATYTESGGASGHPAASRFRLMSNNNVRYA